MKRKRILLKLKSKRMITVHTPTVLTRLKVAQSKLYRAEHILLNPTLAGQPAYRDQASSLLSGVSVELVLLAQYIQLKASLLRP